MTGWEDPDTDADSDSDSDVESYVGSDSEVEGFVGSDGDVEGFVGSDADVDRAPICPYCGVTALPSDPTPVLDPQFVCENAECEAFGEPV